MSRKGMERISKERRGESFGMDLETIVSTSIAIRGTRNCQLMSPKDQALLQQIEISKQDGPTERDLRVLRNWLITADGNDSALVGPGAAAWHIRDEQSFHCENDFVVFSAAHRYRDRFERWTGDTVLGKYHRFIARHFKVCPLECVPIQGTDGLEDDHQRRRAWTDRIQ